MRGVSEARGTNYSFKRWKTSAVVRLLGFSEEERVSSSETLYRVAYIFPPSHSIRNFSILHFNYFHHQHRGPYFLLLPPSYFKYNQHIYFTVIIIIIIIIIIFIISRQGNLMFLIGTSLDVVRFPCRTSYYLHHKLILCSRHLHEHHFHVMIKNLFSRLKDFHIPNTLHAYKPERLEEF
jgi:hypothetical protein